MADDYEFDSELEALIIKALEHAESPGGIRFYLEEYSSAMQAIEQSAMPRHGVFTGIIERRQRLQKARIV